MGSLRFEPFLSVPLNFQLIKVIRILKVLIVWCSRPHLFDINDKHLILDVADSLLCLFFFYGVLGLESFRCASKLILACDAVHLVRYYNRIWCLGEILDEYRRSIRQRML